MFGASRGTYASCSVVPYARARDRAVCKLYGRTDVYSSFARVESGINTKTLQIDPYSCIQHSLHLFLPLFSFHLLPLHQSVTPPSSLVSESPSTNWRYTAASRQSTASLVFYLAITQPFHPADVYKVCLQFGTFPRGCSRSPNRST
jgi:hypothetical protein